MEFEDDQKTEIDKDLIPAGIWKKSSSPLKI